MSGLCIAEDGNAQCSIRVFFTEHVSLGYVILAMTAHRRLKDLGADNSLAKSTDSICS